MKTGRPDYDAAITVAGDLIPDDEPVFLIRAQDLNSGDVVRAWAKAAERHGADSSIVDAVRRHAAAMDLWPIKKTPDAPMSKAAELRTAYEDVRRRYREDNNIPMGAWRKA